MVFVTVGTTKFPFGRLLKTVDEAMIKVGSREELVVQKGTSSYSFNYPKVKIFEEIAFDKMISYLKEARIVICHGGPATIFLALEYAKNKPLVIPRNKELGEHVSDHQELFTKFLRGNKLVEAAFPGENLSDKILSYVNCPRPGFPVKKERVETLSNLATNLNNYCGGL